MAVLTCFGNLTTARRFKPDLTFQLNGLVATIEVPCMVYGIDERYRLLCRSLGDERGRTSQAGDGTACGKLLRPVAALIELLIQARSTGSDSFTYGLSAQLKPILGTDGFVTSQVRFNGWVTWHKFHGRSSKIEKLSVPDRPKIRFENERRFMKRLALAKLNVPTP